MRSVSRSLTGVRRARPAIYGSNPKATSRLCVGTKTLPLATVGMANFTATSPRLAL